MKLNKLTYRILLIIVLLVTAVETRVSAQPVPGKDENIYSLVTFGKEGKPSWGDPNFYSVWFFLIPKDYNKPFYIKVFDADCGGQYDEIQGDFNTKTRFSVYGGKGVDPDQNTESQGLNKTENFKSGNQLASKVFGAEAKYDNNWYTFGPFNYKDGDFSSKWDKYVFKVVCEGIAGDDGNLYKYFLSSNANSNIEINGANAFTYFYSFRMWNDFKSVAHIYPFIEKDVIIVTQTNFDWDNDGKIQVVSRHRIGDLMKISNEEDEAKSEIAVNQEKEVGASLDFQFHKKQESLVKNNNVVISLRSQTRALVFVSSPIGGVPKYETSIGVNQEPPDKKK
jgi:hypothetical protein